MYKDDLILQNHREWLRYPVTAGFVNDLKVQLQEMKNELPYSCAEGISHAVNCGIAQGYAEIINYLTETREGQD